MQKKKIVVVGAGPAGMMAAIKAGSLGQDVILVEKNSILGNKLLLSGKGRCNLTNACELDLFLERFPKSGQFLRDAFKKFFNQDLMSFFQERGLELKVERQLRVFPVTDRSTSIVDILKEELLKQNVKIMFKFKLIDILIKNNSVKGIYINDGELVYCDKLILATGGASYSFTGSTGEGLAIVKKIGHEIVTLLPGLIPLDTKEDYPRILKGLTLKNISIKFCTGKLELISEVGELLFTGTGISGPLVLTLSAKVVDWLSQKKDVYVQIDLKPGLTYEQLDARLLREFKANPKKGFKKIAKSLLPLKLIDIFLKLTNIDPFKKANQLTQKERNDFVSLLKCWRLVISSSRPIEEGMVTQGGVSLKEINPRTMESRIIKGLYFCGEMIDVDADTGGFNLQAAFSTGYLAGESAGST
ncbi:MAG: NAD(P)/FAD-dependent oxidoreductase [Candidatus Omnitrophica bacterium]|nr:NAD(P)/FAD-dependent oxidoreductase [Candidatus Omnitrophota bacterium]